MNGIIILVSIIFENYLKQSFEIIKSYSLMMICFNVIPIYPLDGYRIIKTFLEILFDIDYVKDICYYLSILLIIILGIIFLIFSKYFYLIIIIYLLFMNFKNHQMKVEKLKYVSEFYKTFYL